MKRFTAEQIIRTLREAEVELAKGLAVICLLVLGGCGGVGFEHPLSDKATTEVDESLIGFWEAVASSMGEKDPEPGDLWAHIAVGKSRESQAAMEAVAIDVEDGFVKVERLEILATRIGEHRYLSLRNPEEADESWFAIRYDVTADGFLKMHVLDAEALARAVDDEELKGEVRSPDRGHEVAHLTVRITSPTSAVRAWMAKHEDCVEEKGIILRRLVKRASSGSRETPDEGEEADRDE